MLECEEGRFSADGGYHCLEFQFKFLDVCGCEFRDCECLRLAEYRHCSSAVSAAYRTAAVLCLLHIAITVSAAYRTAAVLCLLHIAPLLLHIAPLHMRHRPLHTAGEPLVASREYAPLKRPQSAQSAQSNTRNMRIACSAQLKCKKPARNSIAQFVLAVSCKHEHLMRVRTSEVRGRHLMRVLFRAGFLHLS